MKVTYVRGVFVECIVKTDKLDQAPVISVIMTTYNAEAHIEESLQSVLSQDISDLEVLCVDGHSTVRTIPIIHAMQKLDPRTKLIYQERPGIGAAKNCGIEHVCGT